MSSNEGEGEFKENNIIQSAQEEARTIIGHQIKWAMQSDKDLMKLFRFNIIVLGIVVSLIPVSVKSEILTIQNLSPIPFVISMVLWLFSIVLIVLAYNGLKISLGAFGDPELRMDEKIERNQITDYQDQHSYDESILQIYTESIDYNGRKVNKRYRLHVGVIVTMSIAILIFTLAIFETLINQFIITVGLYAAYIIGIVSMFIFGYWGIVFAKGQMLRVS